MLPEGMFISIVIFAADIAPNEFDTITRSAF
jgi:hypothetical protein